MLPIENLLKFNALSLRISLTIGAAGGVAGGLDGEFSAPRGQEAGMHL